MNDVNAPQGAKDARQCGDVEGAVVPEAGAVASICLVVLRNLIEEYDAWPEPKPAFESYSIEHARALVAKHGGLI